MMSSYFQHSGCSGPMPLVARSEVELIQTLNLWIRDHNERLPPGTIVGSILNVKNHKAKKLVFVGTSETISVDRLLINRATIGWVLRAVDGSCMLTRHTQGNSSQWGGYSAWLGGDLGFTATIVASTDGAYHKPSKLKKNAIPCDFGTTNEITHLGELPGKHTKDADVLVNFPINPEPAYADLSPNERNKDSFTAPLAKYSATAKVKSEGHRYPTTERRLACFSTGFEAWESQGNRGEQTPPISSFDTLKRFHWPPQHPGTPPPTLQKKPKRQQHPRKLQEAAILQLNRHRSPSIELISVDQASPRRRGRPPIFKPGGSSRVEKAKGVASAAKLPPTPKTPSRRASEATTILSPITPTSKPASSKTSTGELSQTHNVVFHFFLSDESFGAIPKLFAQCATPKTFFDEANAAWHALSKPNEKSRLLGVKVIIEGVTRPIVLLWDSVDGFERMVEIISSEMVGRTGNMNVEVRCIKLG